MTIEDLFSIVDSPCIYYVFGPHNYGEIQVWNKFKIDLKHRKLWFAIQFDGRYASCIDLSEYNHLFFISLDEAKKAYPNCILRK